MIKKIFLLLLLTIPIFCNAQKIITDRVEDDGRRQIMCSGKDEKLDGAEYNFCIKAFEKYGSINWCLIVSSFNYIPENVTLLLKLGNNEVITLYVNNRTESKIDMPTYSYVIGRVAYTSPTRQADYYTALFDLSIEELNKIEDYGIIKVRISSRKSYNEKSWKKDKLGKFLAKSWRKIEDKYEKTVVKSIYHDF